MPFPRARAASTPLEFEEDPTFLCLALSGDDDFERALEMVDRCGPTITVRPHARGIDIRFHLAEDAMDAFHQLGDMYNVEFVALAAVECVGTGCLRKKRIGSLGSAALTSIGTANIDLSGNYLLSLPSFGDCHALVTLNLSNNDLLEVPPSIGNASTLRSLDLSNNLLKGLPEEVGRLKKLSELYLQGNPLEGPILDVCRDVVQTRHLAYAVVDFLDGLPLTRTMVAAEHLITFNTVVAVPLHSDSGADDDTKIFIDLFCQLPPELRLAVTSATTNLPTVTPTPEVVQNMAERLRLSMDKDELACYNGAAARALAVMALTDTLAGEHGVSCDGCDVDACLRHVFCEILAHWGDATALDLSARQKIRVHFSAAPSARCVAPDHFGWVAAAVSAVRGESAEGEEDSEGVEGSPLTTELATAGSMWTNFVRFQVGEGRTASVPWSVRAPTIT